ncbi:hypothetical protein C0989_001834 [Termitomyces sp. Mn162]|nr:hypothetical protein C0989_001834 [Termitomyces sp. Mn162]
MQIKFLLATLASSFLSIASGAVVNARAALIVFDPPITSPNASTVWIAGNMETVTWKTEIVGMVNESIPLPGAVVLIQVLNGLRVNGFTLANVSDLRSGAVNVTVPESAVPGQYVIDLFGDSGNVSPPFEIVAAN